MSNTVEKQKYKRLSLDSKKLKSVSITPKIKNGKLLFNKENKSHRYIVEDDK